MKELVDRSRLIVISIACICAWDVEKCNYSDNMLNKHPIRRALSLTAKPFNNCSVCNLCM